MKEAQDVRDELLKLPEYPTVDAINKGGCEEFARRLTELVGGEIVYGGEFYDHHDDLKRPRESLFYGYHWVAKIDGLYYAADDTDSVSHPDDMNFYKKKIEQGY